MAAGLYIMSVNKTDAPLNELRNTDFRFTCSHLRMCGQQLWYVCDHTWIGPPMLARCNLQVLPNVQFFYHQFCKSYKSYMKFEMRWFCACPVDCWVPTHTYMFSIMIFLISHENVKTLAQPLRLIRNFGFFFIS